MLFSSTNWSTADELVHQLMLHCNETTSGTSSGIEIEKKWLITRDAINWINKTHRSSRPGISELEVKYIDSVWLGVNPEIRARAYYDDHHRIKFYKITYKGNDQYGGLARKEIEARCTEDVYRKVVELASQTAKPYHGDIVLHMKFWIYTLDGTTYEFKSMDNGAEYQLEIEFPSIDEANAVILPEELQRTIKKDVTSDPKYKLKNYWIRTRLS